MRLSAATGMLLAALLWLAACGGGGVPSREEFIASVRDAAGEDFRNSLEGSVDTAQAQRLFDRFVGCVYDQLREDPDVLQRVMQERNQNDLNDVIGKQGRRCLAEFNAGLRDQTFRTGG